ncbi:hypothetical protein B0H16DRAFT_1544455 [Mycena metata]|uniref:MARVEL domain-containing protein n=1 Tax=Mycena metata TaxID=1033252 RepID=A0AAD7J386_9AGAR|nr:hypothetical protein B0H16DRAFT_1544455 [Mycena metata]
MGLPLTLIRVVVFSTSIFFALLDLALAGAVTSTSTASFNVYFPYAALAIATAILTFLTLPAMLALEKFRPGGPTSMIIVEICWLFLLSILWLATGADAADYESVGFWFACGNPEEQGSVDRAACSQISAIAAFAFLNWIILMGYIGTLLVLSLAAASRKHTGVWTSSVADAPFGAPAPAVDLAPMSTSHGGQVGGTASGGQVGGVGGHTAGYSAGNSVQAGTVHV